MITRIVQLNFRADKCAEFEAIFSESQLRISSFKGCFGVKLWRDIQDSSIYFTYSKWDNLESLEKYRNSDLFKSTWQKTKPLFSAPAQAWSVEEMLK